MRRRVRKRDFILLSVYSHALLFNFHPTSVSLQELAVSRKGFCNDPCLHRELLHEKKSNESNCEAFLSTPSGSRSEILLQGENNAAVSCVLISSKVCRAHSMSSGGTGCLPHAVLLLLLLVAARV